MLPVALALGEDDNSSIVPRLQSAVARVLPAIEATVARLAAEHTHPREIERAARALAALTRTLRELNGLLSQRQAAAAAEDERFQNVEELRHELARRMNALIAERTGPAGGAGAANEPPAAAPHTIAPHEA